MTMIGLIPASDLGLKEGIDPKLCFTLDFIYNFLWQTSYRKFLHKFDRSSSTISNYRAFRTVLPRRRTQKIILILTVVLLNLIYEEILYRGFLVHDLALTMNNVCVPIIIGCLVCVILHLYQGVSVIHQHILNYGLSVALLFSPLGLIGMICFHCGADLFPFLWIKEIIKDHKQKYREYRNETHRLHYPIFGGS